MRTTHGQTSQGSYEWKPNSGVLLLPVTSLFLQLLLSGLALGAGGARLVILMLPNTEQKTNPQDGWTTSWTRVYS